MNRTSCGEFSSQKRSRISEAERLILQFAFEHTHTHTHISSEPFTVQLWLLLSDQMHATSWFSCEKVLEIQTVCEAGKSGQNSSSSLAAFSVQNAIFLKEDANACGHIALL